jgi:hypothetical protein
MSVTRAEERADANRHHRHLSGIRVQLRQAGAMVWSVILWR